MQKNISRLNEELKIRISPEDKERIKLKMGDAGVLNMSAYVRKMDLDGICIRLDLKDVHQLISMLQRCTQTGRRSGADAVFCGA